MMCVHDGGIQGGRRILTLIILQLRHFLYHAFQPLEDSGQIQHEIQLNQCWRAEFLSLSVTTAYYTMGTRSSVLGKRGHQDSSNSLCEQLKTPDNTPNPKRTQTATVVVDGDSNKENVPPFNISPIHIAATPTSDLMELTLSTPPPSPPTSLLSIQARVRALLRSTCNNTSSSIAGRDVECTSLLQFLTSFIDGTFIDHDTHTTSMLLYPVLPERARQHW